jgi:hypothetical protein
MVTPLRNYNQPAEDFNLISVSIHPNACLGAHPSTPLLLPGHDVPVLKSTPLHPPHPFSPELLSLDQEIVSSLPSLFSPFFKVIPMHINIV